MDITNLDLRELESSASSYYKLKEGGQDQVSSIPRKIMDGIIPVLEAISSGECQALFNAAMDSKFLCIASLLCEPPAIGLSLKTRPDGSLVRAYDGKHAGKGFRAVCVGLSEYRFPNNIAEILSREVAANGQSYQPNTLVKNGIYELSKSLARARLDPETLSIEHLFTKEIFRLNAQGGIGAIAQLSDLILQEMFTAHFDEGRSYRTESLFEFLESLASQDSNGAERVKKAFDVSVKAVISKSSFSNIDLLMKMLLNTGQPVTDKYRLILIKAVDEELSLDDYLKASLKLVESHKGVVSNYLESVADIYIELGYEFLTSSIRDSSDWKCLSDLPKIDMSKISIQDIPRMARGAALELELGL